MDLLQHNKAQKPFQRHGNADEESVMAHVEEGTWVGLMWRSHRLCCAVKTWARPGGSRWRADSVTWCREQSWLCKLGEIFLAPSNSKTGQRHKQAKSTGLLSGWYFMWGWLIVKLNRKKVDFDSGGKPNLNHHDQYIRKVIYSLYCPQSLYYLATE